ncbi:MAG: LysE family transporter [Deltaproteobacteria bacterium]|nr:LysE family transporter [Deltaproteobacteria bacterium]MBW2142696.1 LysE family transporter [Deltaproteobacteria bacterium]
MKQAGKTTLLCKDMLMLHEFLDFISIFWLIFSFSFLVALTGAMAPGPLLTYTIIRSAQTAKRGYLTGLWVIAGHALLEILIIILLLLGFSFVVKNILFVRVIGVLGGLILAYFGFSIIRDIYRGKISTSFLNASQDQNNNQDSFKKTGLKNPVLGGFFVSMSNPYWWVWWATIGFAFMLQFDISLRQWPKLISFFLGHEAGDLAWYLLVSILTFFGLRHLNKKTYYAILTACAVFMILFGVYLGISPFFKASV